MSAGYEINVYQPDFMPQVVNLLRYLWGNNHDNNLFYFIWKYVKNPFTESPLGIVALYKGEVVGFRGYFATKWQIGKRDYEIPVLCPGDTCVHPDHRMKGLSVAMGDMAIREYESKYKIFLNMSAGKNSVPGYLKMGFVPLYDKVYLSRFTNPLERLRLYKFVQLLDPRKPMLPLKTRPELYGRKVLSRESDDIIVANYPRLEEMCSIISGQHRGGHAFSLLQDKSFFQWRFNNQRNNYLFYYSRKNNVTTGYIVMCVSKNNWFGRIIDYAENDSAALKKILEYVIHERHFSMLSILDCSLEDNFLKILKDLRINKNRILHMGKRIVKGIWPLLIRPVKNKCRETDWFIEGIDIRKIGNWHIKEISSDYS